MVGALIDGLKEKGFPYNARPDGSCEKLEGTSCSVYEDRPDICRIDVMSKQSGLTVNEYYNQAIDVCNHLKRINGQNDFI